MDFTRYLELKGKGIIELRQVTEGSKEILIIKKKWDADTGVVLASETTIANQQTVESLNNQKTQMETQIAQVQKQIVGVNAFLADYEALTVPSTPVPEDI